MKTIYNTYVTMESQEQCDRMKQLCIDNNLPIWEIENDNVYPFEFQENFNNIFEFNYSEFAIWTGKGRETYSEVSEQEFIELLKNTKL